MAHATIPTGTALADHVTPAATTAVQPQPVTPGKVAMWLFLATEVMFFTGLIGSYIALPSRSPATAYSNLYSPAQTLPPRLEMLEHTRGVLITSVAPDHKK